MNTCNRMGFVPEINSFVFYSFNLSLLGPPRSQEEDCVDQEGSAGRLEDRGRRS